MSVFLMRVPRGRSRVTARIRLVASIFGPCVFEMKIQVSNAADTQAAPKIISIFCRSIPSPRIPQKHQRAESDHGAVSEAYAAWLIHIAALAEFSPAAAPE